MTHTPAGSPIMMRSGDNRDNKTENTASKRVRKLTLRKLRHSGDYVPQVSYHDEVDISIIHNLLAQSESQPKGRVVQNFSKRNNPLLPFIIQVVIDALRAFPQFNAALNEATHALLIKHYYHIAIAFDMPNGLIAPVIKNADTLTLDQLKQATAELPARIQSGNLRVIDTAGASFSLTNLTGAGGTGFSPTIKAPEVAVLGISQDIDKVVARHGELLVRRTLPLSLSYDYRAINEAMAAHFMAHLRHRLESPLELFNREFSAHRTAC